MNKTTITMEFKEWLTYIDRSVLESVIAECIDYCAEPYQLSENDLQSSLDIFKIVERIEHKFNTEFTEIAKCDCEAYIRYLASEWFAIDPTSFYI